MSDVPHNSTRPEDWRIASLGELCRSGGGGIQTGPFGSQLHASDYKEVGIPIVTVEHLREGGIAHANLPLVGEKDATRLSRYTLVFGDLVFSRVGSIDRCAHVSEAEHGWLFSGRCLRVRTGDGKTVDAKFLSYLLNSWRQRQWILNHSVGSTMACLNTSILSSVPVELPSKCEQRRIAEILSTLDNAIEQTETLIAKYQQAKAGLMQDLFTRGVTPDGQLRPPRTEAPDLYKESPLGWVPKEWSTCELQDLVSPARPIVYGILMPGTGYPGGVPVVKVKDIVDGAIRMDELLLTSPEIDSEYQRSRLMSGDILITIRGTVGRLAIVPENLSGANITQDTARIGIVRGYPKFYRYYLETTSARAYLSVNTIGVAVQGINLGDVRATPVPLAEYDEQERIASRLSIANEVIEQQVIQLQKLRMLKHGLMHDLLTGRVRVNIGEPADA